MDLEMSRLRIVSWLCHLPVMCLYTSELNILNVRFLIYKTIIKERAATHCINYMELHGTNTLNI